MTKFVYSKFYGLPLYRVVIYMVVLIFVWEFIGEFFQKNLVRAKVWKVGNSLISVGMLGIIFIITILSRESSTREVILIPFYSFLEAKTQPELYRSMLMNVFLFFPLGLSLPFVLPEKCRYKELTAIVIAMSFSGVIEYLQYFIQLGRSEVDDILCNTLGCMLGTMSYVLLNLKKRMYNKIKEM